MMMERFKRPLESYDRLRLGIIGLVAIGAMVAGIVLFGSLDLGKKRCQAEFAQAAQIGKGNQVTIAGIQVGTVDRVTLAGDHVLVAFNVRKDVRLGYETRAAIKQTTILGSRYLELTPAGAGDIGRRVIGLANTDVPYDLQKAITGATSTFEPIDAERVVESVRTLNSSLQGLPEALPRALQNIQSLAAVMGERRSQIGTLLANAEALTTMLRDQRADMGVLVLQGRDVLSEIATRRAALQQLFASATTLVDRVKAILGDEPAINQLIANMQEFTTMMVDHDALIRNFLQTTPVAVRNLTNATGSGNHLEVNIPAGFMVDSWMCALSSRAPQFNLVPYYKDCA